jgi:hypothetical protein
MLTPLDTHAYFSGFQQADRHARSCEKEEQQTCQAAYHAALRPVLSSTVLSPAEKRCLARWIEQARLALRAAGCPRLDTFLPTWNVCVVPDTFENGYPHTHADIIVLPKGWIARHAASGEQSTAVETLIHERVHVFQRSHPIETHALLLRGWGLRLIGPLDKHPARALVRANPDVNGLLYDSGRATEVLGARFRHANASSLADIEPGLEDHPYEQMATQVARLVMQRGPSSKKPSGDAKQRATWNWMQRTLGAEL